MIHDPQPFQTTPGPQAATALSLWRGAVRRRRLKADIAQETADRFGLTLDELKTPTHARRISWRRMIAMHDMREAGWGWPSIGRYFGLDHTTAIHAHNRVQAWRAAGVHDPFLELTKGANHERNTL